MARPPKFGTPAVHVIVVRVTDEQRTALAQVAGENQTDLSGVIREAVNTYVADYKESVPFRITKP